MTCKRQCNNTVPKREERKRKSKRKQFPEAAARNQFAALGLFIQNFEDVVSVMRAECGRILRGGSLGLPNVNSKVVLLHWNICSLVFHHEAMTAKPIADLWQALTFEQCRAMVLLDRLSERGSKIANEIASEIANEFREIIPTRNHLVHGSWHIGRWLPNEDDFSKMRVEKHKVTKNGLILRDDMPKSFDELMALAKQNQAILGKLGRFLQYFIFTPKQIEAAYSEVNGKWVFIPPSQRAISTSPPSP